MDLEQWFLEDSHDLSAFLTYKLPEPIRFKVAADSGAIQTLEGEMKYECGHIIITGPAGEQYPVHPDTFIEKYNVNQSRNEATPKKIEKLAKMADHDGVLHLACGVLEYKANRDYIVRHAPGEYGPVRADIFEITYHIPQNKKL